jgi:twinkle protein
MKTFRDYGIDVPEEFVGEKLTTCPQCSHTRKKKKDKCLSSNWEKGLWRCFHCGWKGSLGKENNYSSMKPIYQKPNHKKQEALPENVIKHFEKRGITKETLERNKISYSNNNVEFPYYRDGELINIKYRGKGKKFYLEKDCERIFYGLDDCINTDMIVICEGEIDKLSLEEAGLTEVISVPNGAPNPNSKSLENHFSFLESAALMIEKIKRVIIAVDNDAPGLFLRDELARRIGKVKCSYVMWPDGCKDANDVLVKHGPKDLGTCIGNAINFPVEGIFEASDIFQQIDKLYHEGFTKGEHPGWDLFSENYTVRPGEWTLVSGVPSHGKSSFLDNLMVNLTKKGWNIGIYSPENQPLERHAASLLEKIIKAPFSDGPRMRISEHELETGKQYLQKHFSFVLPEEGLHNIDNILRLAKALVLRKGIKGFCIDPYNELDHSRTSKFSETEYVSDMLSKIRRFARTYGVHVWLVAHPTKLKKGDNGKYPVPTPYDVSGSAHFRNKADNCICVWRDVDDDSRPVEVYTQKIRFKEIGKIGCVEFKYDKATGIYTEALPSGLLH